MTKIDRHRVKALLRRRFGHEPDESIVRRRMSGSTSLGERSRHDESGAVLILALVFLVAVSVIIGGLTDWTTNDLRNSANFAETQNVTSSATNAVNLAIQNIRYTPLLSSASTDQTLNTSPPSYCWGSSASQQFNMNVYCSSVWNPKSANTRTVTISACPTSRATSWAVGQTSCAAQPLLQAVVTFDDYPAGVSAPNPSQCAVYCGTGLTINSWNWSPVVPVVTGVVGLSGPITGGTPMVITGTGFTSGATVNFVNVDPLAQLATTQLQNVQQIVPATNVSVNVVTGTITAHAPAVTTLANYYVTVTTSGGTSAYNSGFEFNYSSVVPAVTGVTPTSGYTTHGTTITITGSGFVNGATVNMVKESGGAPVSPLVSYAATAVQVVSNNVITAITYPVTTTTSYFVTVTTPAGASPYGSVASDVFTFTPAPA